MPVEGFDLVCGAYYFIVKRDGIDDRSCMNDGKNKKELLREAE